MTSIREQIVKALAIDEYVALVDALELICAQHAKAFFNDTMHQPTDAKEVDTLYDNFKFKKDQN